MIKPNTQTSLIAWTKTTKEYYKVLININKKKISTFKGFVYKRYFSVFSQIIRFVGIAVNLFLFAVDNSKHTCLSTLLFIYLSVCQKLRQYPENECKVKMQSSPKLRTYFNQI